MIERFQVTLMVGGSLLLASLVVAVQIGALSLNG